MHRIAPLEPPYDPELAAALERWMPPGSEVEPLQLFRVLAHNRDLFDRMRPLGSGLLGHGRLTAREREILLLRTTARAGAGYEWGVHVSAFASAAGLTDGQVLATAVGTADDPAWDNHPDDRLLVRVADAIFDDDTIPEALWPDVTARFETATILEVVILCGWYRMLSTVIRTTGLEAEPWARPFPETERSGAA